MHCELRHGSEVLLYEPLLLEDEVRGGRLRPEQEVRHAPWTGGEFRRIRDIAALADALDAPGARLAARFRGSWFTPATLLLFLALCGWALFQLGVGLAHAAGIPLPGGVLALTAGGDVGWGSVVLDGRWWTQWTGAFLHAGLFHLVANLPVLVYTSWRVERAVGVGGQVLVGAAAIALGTTLIVAVGDYQAVGSSILAYGYWGAQIALGLRLGERIPEGWRGSYGWGNLVFFIPLFVSGLDQEGVSHLGHVGGLLGGVAAAFLAPLETAAPAARSGAVRLRLLGLAAAVLVAPVLVFGGLSRVASAAGAPWTTVERPDQGLVLELPARLARHEVRLAGLDGWAWATEKDAWLYADVATMVEPGEVEDLVADWWRRRADAAVQVREDAPPPIAAGWQVVALTLVPPDDRPFSYVEEHVLVRGQWVWRVGFQVPERRRASPRVGLYREALARARVGDPAELVQARHSWEKDPTIPERAWRYAGALVEVGEYAEADRVLVSLDGRTDGWEWSAARERMRLWGRAPELAERADPAWVQRYVRAAPAADLEILGPGVEWLVRRRLCGSARAVLGGVHRENPQAAARLTERVAGDLVGCETDAAPAGSE